MPDVTLTDRQRQILEFIDAQNRERGYPPSVREICAAVGLTSPSTVHSHLASLQKLGFLRRDPTKPRALEVRYDPTSGAAIERRPVRHVPLVGDVAAGTGVLAQENVDEVMPLPADLTGDGELFMLTVRGDSMIDAGILDGDYVVARSQNTADKGDIVVAGIPGDEATVKTFASGGATVVLEPANPSLEPMQFRPDEVTIYGKVVTVLRKL
ncbi:MAG: transcriptional repressor LexA [Acidimicrobiia bacterium]|nr:transcriptional repressor LexA [Acidimicrobiia bacterium]